VDHEEFDTTLAALPDQLRAAYPRAAHRGRIEQIEAHVTTLRHLVGQLPDEEEREAEYEQRLLALHGSGFMKPNDRKGSMHMPDDAWNRLEDALRRKEAVTS
jgi:hypothetical protein